MFLIPIELTFSHKLMFSSPLSPGTALFILLLCIDLILSFNTAYYEFGQVVISRSKIALYMLGKSWGLEVLSIVYLMLLFYIYTITE